MPPVLFDSFAEWLAALESAPETPLWQPVLRYEVDLKGKHEAAVWEGLATAYAVMRDAIESGLTQDMRSISGMIDNGAKKIAACEIEVLGPEFKRLLAVTTAAKEVNSCMGRVVAAPTAGASGILPGILATVQDLHSIPEQKILEGMLVAAGIGLIIEKRAGIAGAVGGCQAETGTAAAMGAGAVVYVLGGTVAQVFDSVAIALMNLLGLVCDPIAGLVEVPCVKRNGSGAVVAFAAAQVALAGDRSIIPVDEVVDAVGEVGQHLDERYKETGRGGIAATPTGIAIAERVLTNEAEIIEEE